MRNWKVNRYYVLDNDAQYKPDFFADLNFDFTFKPGKFDIVFCLEVMEYIFNPVQAHLNIFHLVEQGGVAYISYPTIYPLHNPPKIDYLRYSKNAIEKLLAEAGFYTWEIIPRIATEGVNSLADFYRYEGMHLMKNTEEIFDIGYCVKAIKD